MKKSHYSYIESSWYKKMCCKNLFLPFCIILFFGFVQTTNLSREISPGYINQEVINSILCDTSYDVRDIHSKKITSPEAINSLRALFISGLYNLLQSPIYTISKAIEILKQKLNLGRIFLCSAVGSLFKKLPAAIIPEFKQLKSIGLALLSFLFNVKVHSYLIYSYLFFTPKAKVTPLVLRC